jgi:nucleoside-diphosphate-sugar epimerase
MTDTVIVTAITSFLGCHVAQAFASAGYRVVGTHHTPAYQRSSLQRARWGKLQESVTHFTPLDIAKPDEVRALITKQNPRLWIHQAGLGKDFASDRYDLAEANLINLLPLDAIYAGMADAGGTVLMAGSGMEYGASTCPNSEDAACWPQSPYGLARLAATLRARQLAQAYGVPTRIARIYTVFGELDRDDRLVTRLFGRLRSGDRIGIAPGVARDICDVADVARGYLRLAADSASGPIFDIFNLSRGTATPLLDLARLAAEQLRSAPDLVFEDTSMLRTNEPPIICGDSRKALARLGWAAKPIAEGLARFERAEFALGAL